MLREADLKRFCQFKFQFYTLLSYYVLVLYHLHVFQNNLSKQLTVILERILSTVRVAPAKLVTALRIIEREERYVVSRGA